MNVGRAFFATARCTLIRNPTGKPAESFRTLLRAMPDISDDADFARPLDMGRSLVIDS